MLYVLYEAAAIWVGMLKDILTKIPEEYRAVIGAAIFLLWFLPKLSKDRKKKKVKRLFRETPYHLTIKKGSLSAEERQKIPDFEGIYMFTNKYNGRMYIGQSTNVHRRFFEHLNGRGNPFVHKAYLHGKSFDWRAIPLKGSGFRSLDDFESTAINAYKAKKKGYNRQKGNHA